MSTPPPYDPTTVYAQTDDITLCPYCQSRTDWVETGGERGEQLHTCLNPDCKYIFIGVFDPEDFDKDGNFIGDSNGRPHPHVEVTTTCRHCQRGIGYSPTEGWVCPEAGFDVEYGDGMWRTTCEDHDTFTAEHEPEEN